SIARCTYACSDPLLRSRIQDLAVDFVVAETIAGPAAPRSLAAREFAPITNPAPLNESGPRDMPRGQRARVLPRSARPIRGPRAWRRPDLGRVNRTSLRDDLAAVDLVGDATLAVPRPVVDDRGGVVGRVAHVEDREREGEGLAGLHAALG